MVDLGPIVSLHMDGRPQARAKARMMEEPRVQARMGEVHGSPPGEAMEAMAEVAGRLGEVAGRLEARARATRVAGVEAMTTTRIAKTRQALAIVRGVSGEDKTGSVAVGDSSIVGPQSPAHRRN